MTLAGTAAFQQVEQRLAQHYLGKLRSACVAIRRGQAGAALGLDLLDRDWAQIEHWQSQSAARTGKDEQWALLCQAFPLAGLEVLTTWQNLPDQARWLEAGLAATLRLGDERAELAILDKLSQVYGLLGRLDKAQDCASRLMRCSQAVGDALFIGRGFYNLGSLAEDRGSYAEALASVERALEIFTRLGARTDESIALYQLGSIALYLGDFEKAYRYFSRHLEIAEGENITNEVCRGLLSVAQACIMLEAYDQAEPYLRRAIRLSRQMGFQRLLGAGYIMLAQWHGEQDQIELELKYYAEGIAVARAIGSQRDVIHAFSNSGLARLYLGDFTGALADLQEGLELARQAGIPRYLCNLQRNIADTYLALNNLEEARPALSETIHLALEMGSGYQMVKALTSAIGYWQHKGWNQPAAVWVGAIKDRPEVDGNQFRPLCERLEAALGPEAYHRAIEAGKALDIEQILGGVLVELSVPQ